MDPFKDPGSNFLLENDMSRPTKLILPIVFILFSLACMSSVVPQIKAISTVASGFETSLPTLKALDTLMPTTSGTGNQPASTSPATTPGPELNDACKLVTAQDAGLLNPNMPAVTSASDNSQGYTVYTCSATADNGDAFTLTLTYDPTTAQATILVWNVLKTFPTYTTDQANGATIQAVGQPASGGSSGTVIALITKGNAAVNINWSAVNYKFDATAVMAALKRMAANLP